MASSVQSPYSKIVADPYFKYFLFKPNIPPMSVPIDLKHTGSTFTALQE